MTLIPGADRWNIWPSSTCSSASSSASILGIFGPVISCSMIPTDIPLRARVSKPAETMDFPTPPLPERTLSCV